MRSLLVLTLLCCACADEPGRLVGITPASLLLGRSAEIEITGAGTHFSSSSRIDLGADLRVTGVTATSETTLRATVEVATGAQPGTRALRIDDAPALEDALAIEAPVSVVSSGPLARGGIYPLALERHDPLHGFTDDPSLALAASPGLTLSVEAVSADRIDAAVAIDASAPLGTASLEVQVGALRFSAPQALEIVDPVAIPTLADSAILSTSEAYGSAAAWIGPGSPLALVEVEAQGATAPPSLLLLDPEGRFPRDLPFRPSRLSEVIDGPRLLVLRDLAGHGDPYPVIATRRPLRAASVVAAHDSIATAALLGGPEVFVADELLSGSQDVRYYAIDLAPGAVGQSLQVETRAGDPETDTRITIIRDDQRSLLGPPSSDVGWLDTLTSPTIAYAGRHYIRVEAGSAFDPAHARYALLVVMR